MLIDSKEKLETEAKRNCKTKRNLPDLREETNDKVCEFKKETRAISKLLGSWGCAPSRSFSFLWVLGCFNKFPYLRIWLLKAKFLSRQFLAIAKKLTELVYRKKRKDAPLKHFIH